jgi:hypothetical protein
MIEQYVDVLADKLDTKRGHQIATHALKHANSIRKRLLPPTKRPSPCARDQKRPFQSLNEDRMIISPIALVIGKELAYLVNILRPELLKTALGAIGFLAALIFSGMIERHRESKTFYSMLDALLR